MLHEPWWRRLICTLICAALLDFCLEFALIYRIWTDVHHWLNVYGTEDLFQRFFMFYNMAGVSHRRVISCWFIPRVISVDMS